MGPRYAASDPATDLLGEARTTLAELYQRAGRRTAAFVSNPWLVASYGFEQGFDLYDDRYASWESAHAQDVSAGAVRWLEARARRSPTEPFFLYLHYLDPHLPYGPLERERVLAEAEAIAADTRRVDDTALRRIRRQARLADGSSALALGVPPTRRLLELSYEAGVERFDQGVGMVLDAISANGLAGTTAVIVTSDHGESLFEHGIENHGSSLYEQEVAVPLVMALPGSEPARGRTSCLASSVDILPLLCIYSGLDCPDAVAGSARAFAGGARGAGAADAIETALFEGVSGAPRHRGVRAGRYKLLFEPDAPTRDHVHLLFDVEADPGEANDLLRDASATEALAIYERLKAELDGLPPPVAAGRMPQRAPLSPDLVERLEALGYGQEAR